MRIPLGDDRRECLRWAACGAIAVLLHGAVAAAVIQWSNVDDAAEPSAALVIDLAPFPVAPPENMTELPPGPEQVEAEASPQTPVKEVKEQVEERPETDQAQEVQSEIAPAVNPEVALATLPPEPQVQMPQEQQLPAPETTAPQMPKLELSDIAAAPVQGQPTIDRSNAIPTWRSAVVALLERNKRYPADARNDRGIAQVSFSLDRKGRVMSSRIMATSGSPALDREALEMIRRSQPFPPPPTALPGAEVRLTVPVRFNMR
jgi:periplasmic protein TonB